MSVHIFSLRDSLRSVFAYYEQRPKVTLAGTVVCNVQLNDPRGFRVRFNVDDFVHLIQLKTKHKQEPKNRRKAVEEIRNGSTQFVDGRYSRRRAQELSWASQIVTQPDYICANWQVLGTGDEAYIKEFTTSSNARVNRVLICKVLGTKRQAVTIFPREGIGERELSTRLWP